jgi:hypothetical protein
MIVFGLRALHARRDAAQRGAQGDARLVDVRPEVLLENITADVREYAASLSDNEKTARSTRLPHRRACPPTCPSKPKGRRRKPRRRQHGGNEREVQAMGSEVCVDAAAMKESVVSLCLLGHAFVRYDQL